MRLSAIYIPKGTLPHIFGENHKGQTINLGGEYLYSFHENQKSIYIDKKVNDKFIKSFFERNITLISAIVGANGTGKTTLLKSLIQELSSTPSNRNCILIFEYSNTTYYQNETDKTIDNKNEIKELNTTNNEISTTFMYYSPNLDYDLFTIKSPISLVNYFESNLSSYYLSNIKRHLFFLKEKNIVTNLQKNYEDFPSYNTIIFQAKSLYKDAFEKVYIQSTLGNKLIKIKNHLLQVIEYSENKEIALNEDSIKDIFEKTDTINDALNDIWNNYKNTNKTQYIHDGENFIENVEVNLLSYLILKDTFSLDGDYGLYSLNKVLKAESFEDKLSHLLNKFIIQTSERIYKLLKEDNVSIDINNLEPLKLMVQIYSESNITYKGLSDKIRGQNVLYQIEMIESVVTFYTKLKTFYNHKNSNKNKGGFIVNIVETELKAFNDFIDCYEKMLGIIDTVNLGGVLEISSEKKLSTGEKSLLDFYASIYNYLHKWKGSNHLYSKNIILLLDEPEQGYHPYWKKKFINALNSTLPLLFKSNKVIENIQIIVTTHDPLTLSDIPNDKIVYLYRKTEDNSKILEEASILRPDRTFGANISDLLADSFFINEGLIGDFAKEKIEKTIEWINGNKESKNRNANTFSKELEYHKRVISIVDEPVVKIKLSEMISELEDSNDFQRQILDDEIKFLTEKRDKLQ